MPRPCKGLPLGGRLDFDNSPMAGHHDAFLRISSCQRATSSGDMAGSSGVIVNSSSFIGSSLGVALLVGRGLTRLFDMLRRSNASRQQNHAAWDGYVLSQPPLTPPSPLMGDGLSDPSPREGREGRSSS